MAGLHPHPPLRSHTLAYTPTGVSATGSGELKSLPLIPGLSSSPRPLPGGSPRPPRRAVGAARRPGSRRPRDALGGRGAPRRGCAAGRGR